ncbi:MAG: hypothetical protein M0021_14920 [Clostridia bacterium]|nr:hypothetical protein [Clostridia bacterium]
MSKLNVKKLMFILVTVLTVTGFALSVYGKQYTNEPQGNNQNGLKAQQIAQFAKLDTGTVLRLYQAVGDWDKLFRNISIYKQLLTLVAGSGYEKQLFELIPQHEATDLYVAYDYFSTNELPLKEVINALELRAKGEDWEVILPKFTETKSYKNYQVLAKEDLRRLLGQGYLPEDIVQADNIARAKDLPLESVLKLKTVSNNWQTIAESLQYKGKEYNRKFKLTIPGITPAAGEDLTSLIAASNQNAEQRKKAEEKKLETEFGLTDQDLQRYLNQGHNPHEIRNVLKLAQANNVTPEEVLDKKKQGLSWEEILAAYPKH